MFTREKTSWDTITISDYDLEQLLRYLNVLNENEEVDEISHEKGYLRIFTLGMNEEDEDELDG